MTHLSAPSSVPLCSILSIGWSFLFSLTYYVDCSYDNDLKTTFWNSRPVVEKQHCFNQCISFLDQWSAPSKNFSKTAQVKSRPAGINPHNIAQI